VPENFKAKLTRGMEWRPWFQRLALAALTALLATGCRTYKEQNHVIQFWQQGLLTNAVNEATKVADKNANNKDAIIWRLEQGAVLRGIGRYEESNKAFDQAQVKIDEYEQKAKVRLGQETGALLSNQANLDYEGRGYDGVMLNTYKALNYLELGEPDKARPELIRAYQRQQDAVELNKKRIEQAKEATAKSKDKAAIDKAQKDAKLQAQTQGAYTNLNHIKVYADYVNPFTVYLDGLFFMAQAGDNSDLERARKSLERVVEFDPENVYVKQDLAAVDGLIHGRPLAPTTYVIFETGRAPIRDQIRIDVPLFLVSSASYVGAAIPKLETQGNYLTSLTATAARPGAIAGDTNVTVSGTNSPIEGAPATNSPLTASGDIGLPATSQLVASMDSVISLDFKNELPTIITKTIASTVIKALATEMVSNNSNQGQSLLALLMIAYQVAVNIADTRTWTTLPKEFQVCRFPTPSDRKIVLEGGAQKIPVTIGDGTINIVYVRSITATGPLLVTQFKLK
jgi:uncharacterized protein